jgi:hypothetical protein
MVYLALFIRIVFLRVNDYITIIIYEIRNILWHVYLSMAEAEHMDTTTTREVVGLADLRAR